MDGHPGPKGNIVSEAGIDEPVNVQYQRPFICKLKPKNTSRTAISHAPVSSISVYFTLKSTILPHEPSLSLSLIHRHTHTYTHSSTIRGYLADNEE